MSKAKLSCLSLFALTFLTGCAATPETPETLAQASESTAVPSVFLFMGIFVAICAFIGWLGYYLYTKTNVPKPLLLKIGAFFAAVLAGTSSFPIRLELLLHFNTMNMVAFFMPFIVVYVACNFVKKAFETHTYTLGSLVLVAGSVVGLGCRYLLELGEVSNTNNFTLIHIAEYFVVLAVLYIFSSGAKKEETK